MKLQVKFILTILYFNDLIKNSFTAESSTSIKSFYISASSFNEKSDGKLFILALIQNKLPIWYCTSKYQIEPTCSHEFPREGHRFVWWPVPGPGSEHGHNHHGHSPSWPGISSPPLLPHCGHSLLSSWGTTHC